MTMYYTADKAATVAVVLNDWVNFIHILVAFHIFSFIFTCDSQYILIHIHRHNKNETHRFKVDRQKRDRSREIQRNVKEGSCITLVHMLTYSIQQMTSITSDQLTFAYNTEKFVMISPFWNSMSSYTHDECAQYGKGWV